MATLEEIAAGLIARLVTLTTDQYAVRGATEWGDPLNVSGNAGVAVVEYDGTTDAATDGDARDVMFKVTMLSSKSDDRSARQRLYAYCDSADTSTSVRSVVDGDDLGGLVDFAVVNSNTGLQEYRPGGDEAEAYLGVEFSVAVGA